MWNKLMAQKLAPARLFKTTKMSHFGKFAFLGGLNLNNAFRYWTTNGPIAHLLSISEESAKILTGVKR